ncbi:hypothetical protein ACOSQ2_023391 [Xanthoceras sorbifolium]
MDAVEISNLCKSLTLFDANGPVLNVYGETQQEGIRLLSCCLMGKMLSHKKINRDAFKIVIEQIWNTVHGVEIELVGGNMFVFHLKDLKDKVSVQSRGPWHFDKSLIVLEEPMGAGEILKMKFQKSEFWVQIYNIPLMCMNKKVTKMLAETIGEVVEVPLEPKDYWGKFIRVKVRIDVTQPLKRGLRVGLSDVEMMVIVLLRYERLPVLCFACGLLGHSFQECSNKIARIEAMDYSSPKFWGLVTCPCFGQI